jgi:threonine dehydratase
MPAMADYSRPVTPEGNVNGMASPRTPKNTGFALTEYTANPSPPSESPKAKSNQTIPDAFLLPNGYPDVRHLCIV